MDKGAHFYRCDFEVHTPRDINWHGQSAVLPEERKNYSESLIRACREKGINAIAITDHHDFTFFPYLKKAAASELDEKGNLVPKENQIIVFPGLELTLASPPCQALLILDSNFPENELHSILTVLGIESNPEAMEKTAQVKRISVANNFVELYERLNTLNYVRGRFIIFPNVSDKGLGTILRSGFANYYKSMPCVGGYLNNAISSLGSGNIDIVNGKNRDYGFKSIALIQTSDNRKSTHEDLGRYTTWIKWAEPTAEALRQACLAKNSRISQDLPVLPPVFITSLDVSNSKFLGRIYIEFNRQYNAIIGGRGTGKSTILEYLRWCLCDQCPDFSKEENELPNYQERRKNLIEKTLLPFDGTVQVTFIKNGIVHIVRRKAKTGELFIKIGSGEFEVCSEENIRNLLPIQAYSQKQLSSVGVSSTELKRLVYSPIRQQLFEFETKFENLKSNIRTCYEKKIQVQMLQNEIARLELELKSVIEQVENLRKNLKGITDEDRATIESHESFMILEQLLDTWISEINTSTESLDKLLLEIQHLPTPIPESISFPSDTKDTFTAISSGIINLFNTMRKQLESTLTTMKVFQDNEPSFSQNKLAWLQKLTRHKESYDAAKERSSSQQNILTQMNQLEERIKNIRQSINEKKQLLNKLWNQDELFFNLKSQWILLHKERADLINIQCERLTGLSDNNLKASLGRGKGTDSLNNTLRTLTSGINFRKDKIDSICSHISSSQNPINEWHDLLIEFEALAVYDSSKASSETFPNTPKLASIGLSQNDLRKLADKITNANFIDLLLVQLEDLPIFEYRTREGEYISFSDASAGQQATSLIHVLLNQDGPTLIIDQPEDDLDNQMVSEIAELICKSKMNRQLIFSSHNANIVVNGDAELVACCDYCVSGDQSKGEIKQIGAIDIPSIKDEITKVMEGGEKAFRLRKEKYGF